MKTLFLALVLTLDIPLPTCFPCSGPGTSRPEPGPAPCTDASCTGTLARLALQEEPIIIFPPVGPPSRPGSPAPCTDASCTGTV